MRRVLAIVGALDADAPGRSAALVAGDLAGAEFEVHVCALAGGPLAAALDAQRVHHTVLAGGPRFRLAQWRQLRHQIARLRPDVVHVWPSAAEKGVSPAVLDSASRVVVSRRAPSASESWYETLTNRRSAARAAALVVDSAAVADCWQARGWTPEKTHVVPPGVPLPPVHQCSREEVLGGLGLPSTARLIAVAGPLELRERLKDLIWATDLLKVIRDDAHLLVCGGGPHRARLVRYTRLCRVGEKVHFLGCSADLGALLPHVEVVWRAGSQPGLPIELVEAMAHGVPVVAAQAPGINELVVHDQTGFLVPIGDRAGLARFANMILDRPELARRLGTAARAHVADRFSAQAMVDRHAAVYREISG